MSRYVELIDSDSFYSNSNNDEENEPAGSITADHDTDEYYCNPCGPRTSVVLGIGSERSAFIPIGHHTCLESNLCVSTVGGSHTVWLC